MKSKPERAVVLREAGLSYPEIARQLGVAKSTAYRWLNPGYAEHHRAISRRWKRTHKGECIDCGAPTDVSGGGEPRKRCLACWNRHYAERRQAEVRARTEEMIRLRAQGLTNIQIGERMGVSTHAVANLLCRGKREGLSVPRSPYWSRAA